MKKNFKNSFGVTGTPAQIQAFKEYAESVGWELSGDNSENYKCLYFSHDGKYILKAGFFWYADKDTTLTTYHLPSQWAEAMQAASDYVEIFEAGEWITKGNGETVKLKHETINQSDTARPATPEEIEAARKPKPTFKKGETVISEHGTIILCDGKTITERNFSGMVIVPSSWNKKGDYSSTWVAPNFTLHTAPVTL